MSQFPRTNFSVKLSPQWGLMGCAGCLVMIFVLGGLLGVLLMGWKFLLGM